MWENVKVLLIKKEKPIGTLITLILFIIILTFLQLKLNPKHDSIKVMGGTLYQVSNESDNNQVLIKKEDSDIEKYIRPSKLPILNNRNYTRNLFLDSFDNDKRLFDKKLPDSFLKNPEDTILNYYSILREAANWVEGKTAGCGTIGHSKTPYPIAYKFLSKELQKKMSYEEFLKTFENILHISLIKQKKVPLYQAPNNILRYFVELETIQGSDQKDLAYFAYYYGFIDLIKEDGLYKISDMKYYGENYLCAPMHGWAYDAEAAVQVMYGGWCKMIAKMHPLQQEEYVIHIPFKGTDGSEYKIEFYELTNDTDIEIAQYKQDDAGIWQQIHLDPNDCLEKQ